MKIQILNTGVDVSVIVNDHHFLAAGLLDSAKPNSLSYLDSSKYFSQLVANPNITGLFVTSSLIGRIKETRSDLVLFESSDPRYDFFQAYNAKANEANGNLPISSIHGSVIIHDTAFVASRGVNIAESVIIEPNVVIMPGVNIGAHSVIRAGSKIGVEGFEHKRTSRGILSVVHDGSVEIGQFVEIGANNTIAKGVLQKNTIIDDYTKTDCLVHVAHGVAIGKRCLLAASAMIAGSVNIGNDVWIGPNSSISSQVSIGNNAFITLGSVVVRDVDEGERVTGNFAVPHARFLRMFRKLSSLLRDD